MEFMDRILGPDISTTMRFIIAFAVVFMLVLALAWLLKRISRGFSTGEKRGRAPRLAVLEAVAIDQRRRLVLVRRDNVEHLVMIGGPSDIVVEPSIQRVPRPHLQRPAEPQVDGGPRAEAPVPVARTEPRLDPSPVPAPRADISPSQRSEPRLAQTPSINAQGEDDGAQRQLAEMAERLEMALRAPGIPHTAPALPERQATPVASTAPAASTRMPSPAWELPQAAGDPIARPGQPPIAANDVDDGSEPDAAADVRQEERKAGALFGRLSRRNSE